MPICISTKKTVVWYFGEVFLILWIWKTTVTGAEMPAVSMKATRFSVTSDGHANTKLFVYSTARLEQLEWTCRDRPNYSDINLKSIGQPHMFCSSFCASHIDFEIKQQILHYMPSLSSRFTSILKEVCEKHPFNWRCPNQLSSDWLR